MYVCVCSPKMGFGFKTCNKGLGNCWYSPCVVIFVLWFLFFFRHRVAVLSSCVLSFLSSGLYHYQFLPRKDFSASKTGMVEEFGLPFAFWWSSMVQSFIFVFPMEQILGWNKHRKTWWNIYHQHLVTSASTQRWLYPTKITAPRFCQPILIIQLQQNTAGWASVSTSLTRDGETSWNWWSCYPYSCQ